MILKRIIILLTLNIFICQTIDVEAQTVQSKPDLIKKTLPERIGFVNDFENLLAEEEVNFLENLLDYYKKTSNREIVVITIDSIPSNSNFEQYALQTSINWKVGESTDRNGLTVLLSKKLKKIRISTNDKTRYYLPDEFVKKVIDEIMIPEFKNDQYNDGILLGLNELIRKWI